MQRVVGVYFLRADYKLSIHGLCYPTFLVVCQVRLSKILNTKKSKIKTLREMNTEAEKKKSFGAHIPEDFQRRYASVIIDLEHLNRDLQDYLTNVQNFCQEVISYENFISPIIVTSA
jgi:uncharacterized protein YllA (UPF0747 family)